MCSLPEAKIKDFEYVMSPRGLLKKDLPQIFNGGEICSVPQILITLDTYQPKSENFF